ncbi:hypothetical protein BaRGS_00033404 [Batillaria attramentaria]|uniref:Uncharacterized protein n=1 Tax=Batillaria attramentaria TaxID=370345 RepID=A0ABD0JKH6_9CAEN
MYAQCSRSSLLPVSYFSPLAAKLSSFPNVHYRTPRSACQSPGVHLPVCADMKETRTGPDREQSQDKLHVPIAQCTHAPCFL